MDEPGLPQANSRCLLGMREVGFGLDGLARIGARRSNDDAPRVAQTAKIALGEHSVVSVGQKTVRLRVVVLQIFCRTSNLRQKSCRTTTRN